MVDLGGDNLDWLEVVLEELIGEVTVDSTCMDRRGEGRFGGEVEGILLEEVGLLVTCEEEEVVRGIRSEGGI